MQIDIQEIYKTTILPLPEKEQLKLASLILEKVTKETAADESESSEAKQPENALVQWLKAKEDNPNTKFPAKIIATDLPVPDRSLEYQWLAANRDEYDGKYVALDGDTLVAVGDGYKEVAVKARQLGVNTPLIVFVEGSNRPKFISGGFWRE
jgi:hypothetical protein